VTSPLDHKYTSLCRKQTIIIIIAMNKKINVAFSQKNCKDT